MKTTNLKHILTAAALLPTLAFGLDRKSKQELDFKLSLEKSTSQGLEIRPVSREHIEDALKKIGGKGQVEFKSGGVIIGSGADGLVATSNTSTKGGAIVVHAPVVAETSITVVGRNGFSKNGWRQTEEYCVVFFRTDEQGNQLPGIKGKQCSTLGTPIRVQAGKLMVSYSNSSMFIELKMGEKKIIPLREVFIPKHPGYKVEYHVHRDACILSEFKKTAMYILSSASIESKETLNSILDEMVYAKRKFPTWDCLSGLSFKTKSKALNEHYNVSPIIIGQDDSFFSVLPGVYAIYWNIDEQRAPTTRNIIVE